MASRAACKVFGTVVVAGTLGSAARAFQDTTRLSVNAKGVQGDNASYGATITPDGRYVSFTSDASNLVAGDKNRCEDTFVLDRTTGALERVSVDSNGHEARYGGIAVWPGISTDGQWVVIHSSSSDLVSGDTNNCLDVFVRDRSAGTTTRVSVDSAGNQADNANWDPAISSSGQFVVFDSNADNLVASDTNGYADAFLHDVQAATTERVSLDSTGAEGNGDSKYAKVTADGRFVAFASAASNLVAGDTNGCWDVFVRDRTLGATERVSVDSSGSQGDLDSDWMSISDDGRFVAFQSFATNLVAGDQNGSRDIFVRDRTNGTTVRASVDSNGGEGDSDSLLPILSSDGARIGFSSNATNLVAGDHNGQPDAFFRLFSSGVTERISVDSSGGEGDQYSLFRGFTADGGTMVFESGADNLVASDTNLSSDVFEHDLCSSPATWTNYGAGFPGTNGVPNFTASQLPSFGTTLTVDLANSYARPTSGFLVLGLQRATIPTKWGGELLVLPLLFEPITFSYGIDSFGGTIPDDVGLCGATVDLQGIEFDPGAQYGLSFSQGLELVIGS